MTVNMERVKLAPGYFNTLVSLISKKKLAEFVYELNELCLFFDHDLNILMENQKDVEKSA